MFVRKKEFESLKNKLFGYMLDDQEKTEKAFRDVEARIDAICKHFNILLFKSSGYDVKEFKRPGEPEAK